MSDEQLVYRARNPVFGTETSERNLMTALADRIEQLVATNEALTAKLAKAEAALSECLERNALLEAQLGKAVGHLRKVHDDSFKQAAGHGLMTTDGRSFSCFQINRCQEVAGECERAITTLQENSHE